MDVIVNGLAERVSNDISIRQLIILFQEADTDLIVEHNGRFIYPRDYEKIRLSEGDRIEFINPNFGG
jgi:thiamine biosynthesis protein ThiS